MVSQVMIRRMCEELQVRLCGHSALVIECLSRHLSEQICTLVGHSAIFTKSAEDVGKTLLFGGFLFSGPHEVPLFPLIGSR